MKTVFFSILLLLTSLVSSAQAIIKSVYFAQTHVVKFDYLIPTANEKLKLISDRQALQSKYNLGNRRRFASCKSKIGFKRHFYRNNFSRSCKLTHFFQ